MNDLSEVGTTLDEERKIARKKAMADIKFKRAGSKPKSKKKVPKVKTKKRKDPMHIKRNKHLDTLFLVVFGVILFLILSHPGDFLFGSISFFSFLFSINLWVFLGFAAIIGIVAFFVSLFR